MTLNKVSDTLKDVVAFVDVWSSSRTENYSKSFIQQLQEMGAEVSKTFDKHVTHVVFKNGRQSTWNKAKKNGVKLVSVLWVSRCQDSAEHIDEELCPAINEENNRNPALNKRTHRCMQPRDIPERTPENDKSMKRKLDRMVKGLVLSSPCSSDTSPFIINEEIGIVYSPLSKRASDMAQRLKIMKEKRESLSRADANSEDDDSSDVDVSFSVFNSCSEVRESKVQNHQCAKTPTSDSGTGGTSIESKINSAEFLFKTAEKHPKLLLNNNQAKKKMVETASPKGLHGEGKRRRTCKPYSSSVKSNDVRSQDVSFGGHGISQSLVRLHSRDIKKPKKSSFKSSEADEKATQSSCIMELFSGWRNVRSPVEQKNLANMNENGGDGPTLTSKTMFPFSVGSKSACLSMSSSDSFTKEATVAGRARNEYRNESASPLEAFCRRRSVLLTPESKSTIKSQRVSLSEDDGVFENYFSQANNPDCGKRRRPLFRLLSEPTSLPPIEHDTKVRKRKRGTSETEGADAARA